MHFLRKSKLKAVADHLHILENQEFLSNVAFLADIFCHLNALNEKLQGRNKTVLDLIEKLDAFGKKLDLFHSDISSGKLQHFSTLKKWLGEGPGSDIVTGTMKDFMVQLRDNFSTRFEDFGIPKDVIAFVRDPFSVSAGGEWFSQAKQVMPLLDESVIQLELIDFQTSSQTRNAFRSAESLSSFWISCSEEYPTIKKLAIFLLTMFGSTCTCESSFSSMNAIRTHERNRLSNKSLEDCLCISLTSVTHNIPKIVSQGKCNFSH